MKPVEMNPGYRDPTTVKEVYALLNDYCLRAISCSDGSQPS